MPVLQRTLKILPGKQQGKFFYLFLCQVLLLVLFPYLEHPGLPLLLFRLLGAVAFISGVYAVSERRAMDRRACSGCSCRRAECRVCIPA